MYLERYGDLAVVKDINPLYLRFYNFLPNGRYVIEEAQKLNLRLGFNNVFFEYIKPQKQFTITGRIIYRGKVIEPVPLLKDWAYTFFVLNNGCMKIRKYNEIIPRRQFQIHLAIEAGPRLIINEQIVCGFLEEELVYKFGNPTNDIFTQGYSIGELDLLVTIISAHLNADTFNRSIYTRGFISQGIINLKGEIDEEQVQALRRSWYNQGVGPSGMNKTPILNAPDGMEFLKLDYSHRDMEYSNYIDYLIKIISSIYQIAPEEINFSSSGRGGGGKLLFPG